MLAERDAAVQLITRKNTIQNRLQWAEGEERERLQPLFDAAASEVERLKHEISVLESSVRDRTAAFERRCE